MQTNSYEIDAVETSSKARAAALAGTRMLIAEIQFDALLALLIDCKAVPKVVASIMCQGLADKMIAITRKELKTEWAICSGELVCRAEKLSETAERLAAS